MAFGCAGLCHGDSEILDHWRRLDAPDDDLHEASIPYVAAVVDVDVAVTLLGGNAVTSQDVWVLVER